MAIPKRAFVVSSAVITFFTQRYAPHVAVYPNNFLKNAATLLLIQWAVQFCCSVLVYPFFFSPLRHLPSAPVISSPPHLAIRNLLIIDTGWKLRSWALCENLQGPDG
jgi:hypothetical protein